MKSISEMIMHNVQDEIILDKLQVVKMKYALQVLKSEGIKLILLYLFYSFLDMSLLFLFCTTLLIPVRTFSGGLHMKTNVTCFLFSFVFFLLSILLLPSLPVPSWAYYLILASSIIIICICAPVATSRKPIVTREKYMKCKKIAISSCILAGIFLLLLNNHQSYQHCGIWVLLLQALQLAIAFVFKRKEGFNYEKF